MKRRFLSFLLVLTMLCPLVLAGCSGGESADTETGELSETTRTTASVTMWVITDEKTTEAAQTAVEEAFNTITQSTFTTYVDLVFCTAAEYEEKLNTKFEEIEAREAAGEIQKPISLESDDQYEVNDLGVTVLKYPEITQDQIDIVYVASRDQLKSLVDASRLVNLNEHISSTGSAKILTDVIPEQFFKHSQIDGKTYAIPNNRVVGDYTYLLVNKDIVTGDANGDGTISGDEIKGTYTNFSSINNIFDCQDAIDYVKQNRTDLVPVLEKFDNPYIHFWSEDGSFSLLASAVNPMADYADNTYENTWAQTNVFGLSYFVNYELMMKKYELNNYFATDVEKTKAEKKFGVAVMKGDSRIIDEYSDDFYIKVISPPELNDDNVFSSFYGITRFTSDTTRALEIITMLNTNSELRNTLQYGVEGVHYELNEAGNVERFNNDYMMDINTTGNVFISYPEEYMDEKVWDRGVKANLDLKVNPITGLWIKWSEVDPALIEALAAESKVYYDKMQACASVEELETFLNEAKAEIFKNEAYVNAISAKVENSLRAVYLAWYGAIWPAPEGAV